MLHKADADVSFQLKQTIIMPSFNVIATQRLVTSMHLSVLSRVIHLHEAAPDGVHVSIPNPRQLTVSVETRKYRLRSVETRKYKLRF